MKNTKKIKFILFALCFIAFFILFSGTSKVNASITLKVKGASGFLNVRASDNENSNILGILYNGDTIDVDYVDKTTGWAKLSSSNYVHNSSNKDELVKLTNAGYCKLSYLRMPSKNIPCKTQSKIVVYDSYKGQNFNTLKEPLKLGTIAKGKIVKVVWTNDSWAKLSNGVYCLKKYLKKYNGAIRYVYNTSSLNIRSSPYVLDNNKVDEVPTTRKVSIIETVTTKDTKGNVYKWARLKNGNYCSLDFLTADRSEVEKYIEVDRAEQGYNSNSDISDRYYSYFTTEPVNLRKGPSTDYQIIKTLDTFTPIIAIPCENGWYKTIDGEYICGDYIAREIIGIDVYLANFSTDKGMIVLHCSNGTYLKYHCCGGSIDYQTPTGSYKVLKKDRELMSALYPAANGINNMNCSLFFNMSNGYAIHCGDPNYLSHGCVHVEDSIQEKIFNFTNVGCPVKVTQEYL